ncbi:MAG: hypothetical protein ACKVS6_05760 [Planctomycetota bacterium]
MALRTANGGRGRITAMRGSDTQNQKAKKAALAILNIPGGRNHNNRKNAETATPRQKIQINVPRFCKLFARGFEVTNAPGGIVSV